MLIIGPLAQAVEHMTFNHVVRGSSPRWFTINAPLAQLVEQLTLNQWVLGSSPRRCTIKNIEYLFNVFVYRGIAQLVESRSPKPLVVGSSPTAPAKNNGEDVSSPLFFVEVWAFLVRT